MNESQNTQAAAGNGVAPKPSLQELFAGDPAFPVMLPGWKGFWFKANGETYVYTKDGEILNTPDYEQYGPSTEWETANLNNNPELIIGFLKANRVRLDSILKSVTTLLPSNRETSLVKTELQTAFMWLGKFLGVVGAANPYPQSKDPKSSVIEKHADMSTSVFYEALTSDQTALVKQFRVYVDQSMYMIRALFTWQFNRNFPPGSYPSDMAIDKALTNAGMWLGQQLNNIRVDLEIVDKAEKMGDFRYYRRKGLSEMRPYVKGEDLSKISVSKEDNPETDMGMIARNPKNHADQWYVAKAYFLDNLELVS